MNDLICTVEEGKLKGQLDTDIKGTPFLSFMGVPYAKAPIGKLRFKAPQPPEKWEGIRDATKQPSPCFSSQATETENGRVRIFRGSEDCLFLNIYTPKLRQNELKPVMVFIHGGAYFSGSSNRDSYGPEFLMTEDVVLVVLQYRLGALGFLAFDAPSLEAFGNSGLKDQLQALRWVQKNIKEFSGDPNNVTVFGHSAGGASVHYLLLSSQAKGLFHKGILQSGTSLCPWSRGINNAKELAKILECTESDDSKILEFLQEVPVEKLLQAQHTYKLVLLDPSTKRAFGPSIEPKVSGAYLSEQPLDLIKSGSYNHVPLMIGYTSHEGMIDAHVEVTGLGEKLEHFVPVPFYFGLEKNSHKFEEVKKKVFRYYFGADEPDLDEIEIFYDLLTDTNFLHGIYTTVKAHAKNGQKPIYFYRISIDTELNMCKKFTKSESKGVCHGDDLTYIFYSGYDLEPGSIEEKSVFRFVKMWANFARFGNPIPVKDPLLDVEWKPVTENDLNYVNIGTELVAGTDPDIERMRFWDQMSQKIKYSY